MQASFYVNPTDAALTILKGAEGNVITVLLPGTRQRVVLIVDDTDYATVGHDGPDRTTVTDLMTDTDHYLRRADCGLGCRCAVEFDY